MIDESVRTTIGVGEGFAVIVAGSDSDMPHIDVLSKELDKYGLAHQVRIFSAHKQSSAVVELARDYDSCDGLVAYIAVAGGSDALSGMLSYHTSNPVISCPPKGFHQSVVDNPPGSSNVYVSHPKNAARFVAQMFAHANENIAEILRKGIDEKVASLLRADKKYSELRGMD